MCFHFIYSGIFLHLIQACGMNCPCRASRKHSLSPVLDVKVSYRTQCTGVSEVAVGCLLHALTQPTAMKLRKKKNTPPPQIVSFLAVFFMLKLVLSLWGCAVGGDGGAWECCGMGWAQHPIRGCQYLQRAGASDPLVSCPPVSYWQV